MKKTLIALGVGIALVMTGGSPVLANGNSPDHKVLICHANEGVKGWSPNGNNVDKDSIMNPIGAGHDSHADDIIPAFPAGTHANKSWDAYPGKNLDTLFDGVLGSVILANGCSIPGTPEPPTPPTVVTISASIDHNDPCGPNNLVVSVPASGEGVAWVSTTNTETGAIDVTATALEGYVLTINGETFAASFSWSFEDSTEPCPVETVPPTDTPKPPVVTPETPELAYTGVTEDWQMYVFGGLGLLLLGLGFWFMDKNRTPRL